MDFDDFTDLMESTRIGDFDAFMDSDSELEEKVQKRVAEIREKVERYKDLIAEIDEYHSSGQAIPAKLILELHKLGEDRLALIAATGSKYSIEDLVRIEMGIYEPTEGEKTENALSTLIDEAVKNAQRISEAKANPKNTEIFAVYNIGEDGKLYCVTINWWLKEHRLDDSVSEENKPLHDLLLENGATVECESVYRISISEEDFVKKMAESNVVLKKNPAFTKFTTPVKNIGDEER